VGHVHDERHLAVAGVGVGAGWDGGLLGGMVGCWVGGRMGGEGWAFVIGKTQGSTEGS
jgi:hypothetical protein